MTQSSGWWKTVTATVSFWVDVHKASTSISAWKIDGGIRLAEAIRFIFIHLALYTQAVEYVDSIQRRVDWRALSPHLTAYCSAISAQASNHVSCRLDCQNKQMNFKRRFCKRWQISSHAMHDSNMTLSNAQLQKSQRPKSVVTAVTLQWLVLVVMHC